MAAKRIYVSLPSRDAELLRVLGLRTSECTAMIARRFILEALYRRLAVDGELQQADHELAHQEREAVLRGRLR